MASLTVFNKSGSEVGSYEFDVDAFAPRISKQLLHDACVMYRANKRQGSQRTRSRAEVKGSTSKMYRQKGTGNARAGSRKSGVRRGGGHIFAKRPRDFSYRLPRKALKAATRMALASKIRDEQVVVIDELSFESPKTRDMAAILKALGIAGESTLVAVEAHDSNVHKSVRNIQRVNITPVSDLNALAVLTPRRLLVTRAALDALQKSRSGGDEAGSDEAGSDEAGGAE